MIDDKSPQSLVVPDGKCSTTTAAACQIRLSFQFETGSYSVTFGTASVARYVVTTEARPPNYLNTFMTYSCTDSDSCALDFAKQKVTELSARKYNLTGISTDLTGIVKQTPQTQTALVCVDDDICLDGVCKIEFDTVSNAQTMKGCEKNSANVGATAGGSAGTGSFDVKCNQPKCNTPETLNKAKAIFAKYNLTDADGRIVDVGRKSNANGVVGSVIVVVGLALSSFIAI